MHALVRTFKKIFIPCLVLFVLFSIFANMGNYFNPLKLCSINIQSNILIGNGKTIRKAIVMMRKENPEAYTTLCTHINRIREGECRASDWSLDSTFRGSNAPGCYIKGSKVIYLKPRTGQTDEIIRERYQSLIKYSRYSKDFWESYTANTP